MHSTDEADALARTVSVESLEAAVCLGCGYALRGLTRAVCPECGRVFDPTDASTYREAGGLGGWRRWARRPPLWHFVGVPVFLLLYPYWSSEPGGLMASLGFGSLLVGSLGALFALVLATDYVARVVAVIHDRKRASLDKAQANPASWLRWIVTPLCLLTLCSAMLTCWPMRVRFWLSREAFEVAVRKIEVGADPRSLMGRIGLYRVRSIQPYASGGLYFQTGTSGWDRVGLDHCSADEGCKFGQLPLDADWFADIY